MRLDRNSVSLSYPVERKALGRFELVDGTFRPGVFTLCLKSKAGITHTWVPLNDTNSPSRRLTMVHSELAECVSNSVYQIKSDYDIRGLFILQCCNCLLAVYGESMLKTVPDRSKIKAIIDFKSKITSGIGFSEEEWDQVCGKKFNPAIEAFAVGMLMGGSFSGLRRLSGRVSSLIRNS